MSNSAKRFIKLFAKNVQKSFGPGQYRVNGIDVTCVHCKYDRFEHGKAQLNTALASFLHLNFTDRSATILTCCRCSYVHWFNKKVERML
jgi:hypothetical protein